MGGMATSKRRYTSPVKGSRRCLEVVLTEQRSLCHQLDMSSQHAAPGDRVTQQVAYIVARGFSVDRHELHRLLRGIAIETLL